MRVALLMPMLLVTAIFSAGESRAADADRQQIRRIDGSYISAVEIEEYVPALMDSAGVMGLQIAIVNDSNVVYEHAWGMKSRTSGLVPDPETVFPGLSLSKPTFAYLVMQLVEGGMLDLEYYGVSNYENFA